MENLRALRDELEHRGWVVTCFPFVYKKHKYFVLVERYVPPAQVPKGQLVQLTFVDSQDTSNTLSGPANRYKIDVAVKHLRKFFGVEWAENLGDFMSQFYVHFGRLVPSTLPLHLGVEEQDVVVRQLDNSDSEDPRKRFCYTVRRNGLRAGGKVGRRSPFNSQKTDMLRPALYEHFKNDEHISFVYSVNPEDGNAEALVDSGTALI
ncbi:hypothetical protein FHX68_1102 [Microbacterium lacticum]|uniref:Uncharacterized protein n=4 Tax=Microbacterium lacticum TaxID=33885 RepID=A0A543L0W7_9MICO|nr:hypothetical protein FHX68_1102 [Microbacterium lacticum]